MPLMLELVTVKHQRTDVCNNYYYSTYGELYILHVKPMYGEIS